MFGIVLFAVPRTEVALSAWQTLGTVAANVSNEPKIPNAAACMSADFHFGGLEIFATEFENFQNSVGTLRKTRNGLSFFDWG